MKGARVGSQAPGYGFELNVNNIAERRVFAAGSVARIIPICEDCFGGVCVVLHMGTPTGAVA